MKAQIEKLIEKIDRNCDECSNQLCLHICPKNHTIIGDVLEKLYSSQSPDNLEEKIINLCDLWAKIGFTKSLQKIFAQCEWEEICSLCFKIPPCGCGSDKMERIEMPKQPTHKAFFDFLLSLGI